VTGRPELPHQVKAPWGYGDNFKRDSVPQPLLQLANKISSDNDFGCPSDLRDITINYRDKSMFKLDPHVDPPEDGQNVFIVGLLSDVVLTFSPPTVIPSSQVPLLTTTSITMRTSPAAISLRR
jgi:hypothetical protein